VLPERRVRPWVVGREQQRDHVHHSKPTRQAHENARNETDADSKFAISHKERNGSRVWKNQTAQHRHHERISTVLQKAIDPELKPAAESELAAKDFVLTKDEE